MSFATAGALARLADAGSVARAASAWANRLMRGSTLTEYGWVPSAAASRLVDRSLARHDAAYILIDPQSRVVSASERLRIERAVLVSFESDGTAEVPPLGRVRVMEAPIRVFGESQGVFLLLTTGGAVPFPGAAPGYDSRGPTYAAGGMALGLPFLLLGSGMAGLGMLAAAHFLVTRRVVGLTLTATQPIHGLRPPRRFAPGGHDELSALATVLNMMRRRAHLLISSMTARENRRRDWLSQLSHDLRTPLAALHLRLDNAAQAPSDDARREMLATAIQDCDRIQKLASGFMQLAELEVTEDFEFENVMPEELVGQAVRGLRPIAQDAGIEVTVVVSAQPTIYADGHRMLRALENVLRNAIRHASSAVVAGVESGEDEVRFFVRDDGEGFTELAEGPELEYTDWLGRRQAGGLGLRVADRVVRAHGGRLMLRNGPAGTEVACVVPTGGPEPRDETR